MGCTGHRLAVFLADSNCNLYLQSDHFCPAYHLTLTASLLTLCPNHTDIKVMFYSINWLTLPSCQRPFIVSYFTYNERANPYYSLKNFIPSGSSCCPISISVYSAKLTRFSAYAFSLLRLRHLCSCAPYTCTDFSLR